MKLLIVAVLFLKAISLAQSAPINDLRTAGGFLEVCGQPETTISKKQLETLKNAPPSQTMDAFNKALSDRTTEVAMCFAYVAGMIDGWKDGHEHGVAAAQFGDEWPKDEKKAFEALPLKQLQSASAAMSRDVPCIPDYVTIGQERDIVVKYIRDQQSKGNFLIGIALTPHVMWLAYQEAFQCPAVAAK